MIVTYILGFVGAGTLLAAFVLGLFKVIDHRGRSYALLNVAGAGIACYASYRTDFSPYMIVLGIWCAAAVIGVLRSRRRSSI